MENSAVYSLLQSKGLSPVISGTDLVIKCLNPEHEDSSPSLKIDKIQGMGHCFSCGFNVNIFRYFGILSSPTSVKVAKLKEKLRKMQSETTGLEMLKGVTPYTSSFRNISSATLKHFNAFTTSLVPEMEDRIIFPILDVSKTIRLFVGRHVLSNANPKYINYPRGVTIPPFPGFLENKSKYIFLVEGIFDFLNMYDKGALNTVCVFGTQTLKADTKIKMLPFKAQGITHIFILFDGDKAGIDGAQDLKPILEELDFIVEIVPLEDNVDPGNLSEQEIISLREYANDKSSNN